MNDSATEIISIYLSVDVHTLSTYFNVHDPSPMYKRQLSHQLEQYILNSVTNAKQYSAIFYKLKCTSEVDKQYTDPLMYAIRSHYTEKKKRKEKDFKRFKYRTWILLVVSLIIVLICQVFVPMVLDSENRFHLWFNSSLDIFSWVLLWRPIDVLLFEWTPKVEEIHLLNKLATSEMILLE